MWYRAQVVEVPNRHHVKVRYVDYGNEEYVSQWNLRELLDEFVSLPIQVGVKTVFGFYYVLRPEYVLLLAKLIRTVTYVYISVCARVCVCLCLCVLYICKSMGTKLYNCLNCVQPTSSAEVVHVAFFYLI